MKVLDVMTKAAPATKPNARLLEVAETMLLAGMSALPVVDGDRVVGIITEGDLLRRWETGTDHKYTGFAVVKVGIDRIAHDFVRSHGGYVQDLMTSDVLSVDEDATVEEAIRLIEKHGFKQLPVTKEGKLTGVLTRRNILEAFVANARRMSKGEHSDEDIKRTLLAIYTRESWAPLDRIDLRVKDGIVEVVGSVERDSQRKAIVATAEGTPGVKRVIDMMSEANIVHSVPSRSASFIDGQSDVDFDDEKPRE